MRRPGILSRLALIMIMALAIPSANILAAPGSPNICDAEELWEGECLFQEDWDAGWYLHPDNDPGDGSAVDTAYDNYAVVIMRMPHSMCIDWRSANCDGSIPPDPPEPKDEEGPRKVKRNRASTWLECVVQAHLRTSIDSFCQRLIAYDTTLTEGNAGFNAKILAARRRFIGALPTLRRCARSVDYIVERGDEYTAGSLQPSQVAQIEADIVAVHSWACRIYYNQTPPVIPVPPSS